MERELEWVAELLVRHPTFEYFPMDFLNFLSHQRQCRLMEMIRMRETCSMLFYLLKDF